MVERGRAVKAMAIQLIITLCISPLSFFRVHMVTVRVHSFDLDRKNVRSADKRSGDLFITPSSTIRFFKRIKPSVQRK